NPADGNRVSLELGASQGLVYSRFAAAYHAMLVRLTIRSPVPILRPLLQGKGSASEARRPRSVLKPALSPFETASFEPAPSNAAPQRWTVDEKTARSQRPIQPDRQSFSPRTHPDR